MLSGSIGMAAVAAGMLSHHPDRLSTAALVRERFPRLRRDRKRPAVWAYLMLSEDTEVAIRELAASPDESIREAVAALAPLVHEGGPGDVATQLAGDDVRQVQLALIEQFAKVERPSKPLVALVESLASQNPRPFVCFHCGTQSNADQNSCIKCRVVTDDPARKAANLLENWRSAATATDDSTVGLPRTLAAG